MDHGQPGHVHHAPVGRYRAARPQQRGRPQPQIPVWGLTGNAAGGDLQPLQWANPPPSPEVAAKGQCMTMTDLNDSPGSAAPGSTG